MSNELANWYDVTRNVREIVRQDYESGNFEDINDTDAMDEYAHEWADGDAVVIYYHHTRALWLDSAIVRGYEDEAREISGDGTTVDAVITACVYLALRQEIIDAIDELRQEIDETELAG